jgi:Tfp pilus assembly protein PilN
MNCSVNLVPAAQLIRRAHHRRQSAWIVTGVILCGLMGGAGLLHRTAAGAVEREAARVQAFEQQRATTQRKLVAAEAERAALIQQLQIVAGARHAQPWAQRLTALTQAAPEGVFLTTIEIGAASPRSAAGSLVRTSSSRSRPLDDQPNAPGSTRQIVRLTGHALDHGALIQLLNTLQALPGWGQAELIRATSEHGTTVTFELACETQERKP